MKKPERRPVDPRPPIIVTGPEACGKTLNRNSIAQMLTGSNEQWIDDWNTHKPLKPGFVHLTHLPLHAADAAERGAVLIHFHDLALQGSPTLGDTTGNWNCGNHQLYHERAMRLIERHPFTAIDSETLQALTDAFYACGPKFCELALRPAAHLIDEDVPF